LRAIIDLSDVPFGESELPIQVQFEHETVNVTSQFPESASIRLEQILTRDIPVVVEVRGDVARGHTEGDPTIEPESIQVTGPASRVEPLAEARITVFLDSNIRDEVEVTRRPTFYDSQGGAASVSGLTVTPEEVEVIIPVRELAGFAEKPITVNWIGEPAVGYRLLNVSVDPSGVLVTGRPAQLELLSRLTTEPLDISGLTDTFRGQVTLDLPDGIVLVEAEPIFVTVEVEPILSSAVIREPVEARGLGEGLEARIDPEEVRVFLFGPLPALDSLEEDDVRVTVDLLNLTGTHTLEPRVTVSANGIEVRSWQPTVVTVLITNAVTMTNELTATLEGRLLTPLVANLLPAAAPLPLPASLVTPIAWPIGRWLLLAQVVL
jgi:YbbR domain-containing protein